MQAAVVDTGPLVAYFDRAETHHRWVVQRIAQLDAPLLVCEAVLAEAAYLLSEARAQDALLALLENGALKIAFRVDENVSALRRLQNKYRNVPMSFADACVVRMAELHDHHEIFTLDSDFSIYRKHNRVPLTLIRPGE
jgi:predicted nucleic acid-binding protein